MFSSKGRTAALILLVLAATAIGFFMPSEDTGRILPLKAALFIIVMAAMAAWFWASRSIPGSDSPSRHLREVPESKTPLQEAASGKTWEGFGKAFSTFYTRLLIVLRASLPAAAVAIYFRKDKALRLEFGEDSAGAIDSHTVSAETGLLAQVLAAKVPMMQNSLPSGFSFSGRPGTEIRSFLGAPLCLKDEPLGVLAVGSEAENDFGEEDLAMAGQTADLITGVMAAFRQGLQEETDGKVFKVFIDFLRQLKAAEGDDEAVVGFAHCLARLFPFDRFTLSLRQGGEGVIHFVQGQLDGLNTGVRFPLDEGLNGWVLKRNTPLVINDIGEGDYLRPRYFRGENSKHGLRSFIGIPLGGNETPWGCFSLESRRPGQYHERSKDVLMPLAIQLELAIGRTRPDAGNRASKGGDPPLKAPRFEIE
jgi:GAF domain-containing protein